MSRKSALFIAQPGDTVMLLKVAGVNLPEKEIVTSLQAVFSREQDEDQEYEFNPSVLDTIHVCHGANAPETYVYLVFPTASAYSGSPESTYTAGGGSAGAQASAQAIALPPLDGALKAAEISHLTVTLVIEGASSQAVPSWHYVVETDIRPEAESDFNDWYTHEHLPGLAAVPGTVRAMRLRDTEGSPRYHALYLLETRETFESEPWLKVRGTEWSSRVRPSFTNSKRTMFSLLQIGLA